MYVQEESSDYIENSVCTNNSAGYGGALLALRNNDIHIYDTKFESNTVDTDGDTLHVRIQNNLMVDNCFFVGNRVINDGNIFAADNSSITLTSSNFTGNIAGDDGGAAYLYDRSTIFICDCNISHSVSGVSGGALYGRKSSNITISNSVVDNNLAENSGGGVYAQEDTFASIEDSDINNNIADYGRVIRVYIRSSAHIMNSSFSGNIGNIAGGVTAAHKSSSLTIKGNTFSSNTASFASVSVIAIYVCTT